MRLITRFELATKSMTELRNLHTEAFNNLARSKPYSMQRLNALASLENIELELSLRN